MKTYRYDDKHTPPTLSIAVLVLLTSVAAVAGLPRALIVEREGATTVKRDIPYGPDALQRIDVYLPRTAKNAPVLFMVHGGAWRTGDKASANVIDHKIARWLPKGFVVISANYRLLPKTPPLEQAQDVAAAIAFAQARAKSWGGDPSRFVVMGHSAGAHLVALLTADFATASRLGAKPWLGTISLDSAALDVVRLMEARHARFYDKAFGADTAAWRAVSPLHRLSGTPVPMLLVCSTQRVDSCTQARRFAAKVTEAQGRATVLPVALSHGESNSDLGREGDYTTAVEAFMRTLGVVF